jgi:hypothetical protein
MSVQEQVMPFAGLVRMPFFGEHNRAFRVETAQRVDVETGMKRLVLAAAAASLIPLAGMSAPAMADPPAWAPAHGKRAKEARHWYPEDHYRKGNYRERRLAANEEIYRGRDGRYYCKRKDGTTGLIIGGVAGGVLGHEIAPGGSKTVGAVLGAVAGGLVGKSLDDGVKCR